MFIVWVQQVICLGNELDCTARVLRESSLDLPMTDIDRSMLNTLSSWCPVKKCTVNVFVSQYSHMCGFICALFLHIITQVIIKGTQCSTALLLMMDSSKKVWRAHIRHTQSESSISQPDALLGCFRQVHHNTFNINENASVPTHVLIKLLQNSDVIYHVMQSPGAYTCNKMQHYLYRKWQLRIN